MKKIEDILNIADIKSVITKNIEYPKDKAFLMANEISYKSVKKIRDSQKLLPLKNEQKLRVFIPDITPVSDWVLFEPEWYNPVKMANLITGRNDSEIIMTSLETGKNYDLTSSTETNIVVLYNATDKKGQREILEQINKLTERVIVIIVHNFWDQELIPQQATIIETSGFRISQLKGVRQFL